MVLLPKDSAKLINSYSKHVAVTKEGIDKLGQRILQETINGNVSFNNFSQNTIHPKAKDPWAVDWLFVVDSLNFCFWNVENKKGRWQVEGQGGYFALGAAINRAMKEGVDILNPAFYATIDEDQLGKVLRSDTPVSIPLLKERVKCLQESGTVLIEKFGGTFLNCIKQAEGSAVKLLEIITESFKHFKDECQYKGHSVSFYKRAQILVADVWTCHRGEGVGFFKDIDQLTMFADYRVPQVLVLFGVLSYSPELMDILKKGEVIKNGSEMEVEIRGCSIHAVELLKEYFCFALFIVSVVAVPQYQPYPNPQSVPILSQTNDISPDGSFSYSYQSGDGQQVEARGAPRASATSNGPAEVIEGSYSYTAPDGSPVLVKYTADEFGFHPQGSHLPEALQRSFSGVVQSEKAASNQESVYQPKVTNYPSNYYRPNNGYYPSYNRRY